MASRRTAAQLSIEIENQYTEGLRRTWRDGKHQRLETLIDEIAAGIAAYGVALRLKDEEWARRQRIYERQSRVRARAQARQERENERKQILDELVAMSVEAAKLRTWLEEAKCWTRRPQPDEFTRFVQWTRDRLERLERAVTPDGIAESLKERQLFPANDPLIDPPEDLIAD